MRKTTLLLAAMALSNILIATPLDTLFIKESRTPLLLDREDNALFYLRIDGAGDEIFKSVDIALEGDIASLESVKLYYGGTESATQISPDRYAPVEYITSFTPGKTRKAIPSYSRLMAEGLVKDNQITLKGEQKLFPGVNYFWVSIKMKPDASILSKFKASIIGAKIEGIEPTLSLVSAKDIEHRAAVGVRQAGDDGSAAFRIPGLVTTNQGTLLGVYDVRYNSSVDLQEHIDIGLSRSTDGGQSWEKMRLPLAFGEYGGMPMAQNGVGDPAILVDKQSGTIWVIAIWSWGMGNGRNWFNSLEGNTPATTSQLVLTRSDDDGRSWSEPINITEQVKDPSWKLLLQGPGRGITTSDGTMVFPIQYKDSLELPHAGIMYSKDRGESWKITSPARSNTTESQVAELSDGSLMLNIRDNRGGSRAILTTSDLGESWSNHPTSRSSLIEPVCQASLISVKAEDNILGRDILIFSNPNSDKHRKDMTIKISLDNGMTWNKEHQINLDEGMGWGYSCLTMVDKETIGILYESSVAHMTFQAVKLHDIVK